MGHRYQVTFMRCCLVLAVAVLVSRGVTRLPSQLLGSDTSSRPAAQAEISETRLLENIKILSSDKFEGRAPASKGEELTTTFIREKFKELGLQPGNPDGTYFQSVPMVGITAEPAMQLTFTGSDSGQKLVLRYRDDFMAWTKREQPEVGIDADMVFVGYGVVAPEYHWDDYKGVDVRGKVLVMLINDPQVPDPKDPAKLDPTMFKGKAMTYYGRWTYKFEMAAQKGAAGCLLIHQTGPAGYPWEVVRDSNGGEQFSLVSADKGMSRAAVEGWMTHDQAKALFAVTGKDLAALEKAAVDRNFRPVPLDAKAALTLHNKIRTIDSKNVVAKLPGGDPKLRQEYVIYTAHWDHLGVGPAGIFHGAADNASGVAGLLEIARAFTKVQPPPRRSILFLAVTGEEKGLLGSQYYAEHPLYSLTRTAADINMDVLNTFGRTRDITVIGLGMSTLDDYVKTVATEQGRAVNPDPEPEKGFYFRSDHFSFAKVGVPALDAEGGIDYLGRPAGWGLKMREKFTKENYHKPSDTITPDWHLSGAVQDLQLLFEVGYRVADADRFPTWSPGSEFRARREAMLKGSEK
ncbi:MAG: M28 family metallopeptidase [Terriglobia bacterium]